MNTKLHTLCDNLGRPVRPLITEGQRSDFKGADVLFKDLPRAKALLGDKGYDSDKIRTMLTDQGITPCIPPKKNRKSLTSSVFAARAVSPASRRLPASMKSFDHL